MSRNLSQTSSRNIGRVLLVAFLAAWTSLPCGAQVAHPNGSKELPTPKKEQLVSRTHDLSSAIAVHVGLSKLSDEKAKSEAITELFWLPAGHANVQQKETSPGVFQVVAPESFHAHLAGIAKWMANGEKQIVIESRVLTVSEETLRKLHAHSGAEWEMSESQTALVLPTAKKPSEVYPGPDFSTFQPGPVPTKNLVSSVSNTKQVLPCRTANIRDAQLKRIISETQSDTATNVMQAPKVTIFDGQEALVSDTTSRPFVTSVKPVEDENGSAMQPIITVLEDGLKIRIKATADAKNEVQLESKVTFGEIGNVEEFTFETPGKFNGTTVQIPEYSERNVNISKKLASDQSLIIDPHFYTEKVTKRRFRSDVTTREYIIVILTPRVIQQQTEHDGQKVAKL